MRIDPDTCRDPDLLAAEVRRLRAVIDASHPYAYAALERAAELSDSGQSPEPDIPPAWLHRPYWVDPPSGWRYGFPRLYDPASDGDMTAWMIRNGYPEGLARQGLPCTFTACTDVEEARKMLAMRDGVSACAQNGEK